MIYLLRNESTPIQRITIDSSVIKVVLLDSTSHHYHIHPLLVISKEISSNHIMITLVTNEIFEIKGEIDEELMKKFEELFLATAKSVFDDELFFYTKINKHEKEEESQLPLSVRRATDLPEEISPSYSRRIIVVPKEISNATIKYASKYRMKGRFPIITMVYNNENKPRGNTVIIAPLARSSQAKVGLSSRKSQQDEHLVEAIRLQSSLKTLLIVDCRPKTSAIANHIKGGGVMKLANYAGCGRCYLGMENIHQVRKAFYKRGDDCCLEWIKGKSLLLRGALRVVESLLKGEAVLVHCSDGWDRTPQVCALAEILLIAKARTIKGFISLIQRIFIDGGHPFMKRRIVFNGSGNDSNDGDECSPIFQQWIEVVYQMLIDRKNCFEFNTYLLGDLLLESYKDDDGGIFVVADYVNNNNNNNNNTDSTYIEIETKNMKKYENPSFTSDIQEITDYVMREEFLPVELFHEAFTNSV